MSAVIGHRWAASRTQLGVLGLLATLCPWSKEVNAFFAFNWEGTTDQAQVFWNDYESLDF